MNTPLEYFDINSERIKTRIVGQNDLSFSFLTHMPIVPGHTLICPIRPVKTSEELTSNEWQAIFEMKLKVCEALKKTFHVDGFNFAWNQGEEAGQTVPHFHLHVLPRKIGDSGIYHYEPREFLYRPGVRATSPLDELSTIANQIRSNSSK